MSWTTSETHLEISLALVGALGELSNITADNNVDVKKDGHLLYSYRYANLASALEMIRPVLAKHDLAVLQSVSIPDGAGVLVETRILHKSGEWMEPASLLMNSGRSAQEVGSAITYGRRYALLACLGLAAAEDDDDGAMASASPQPQRTQQSTPSPTTRPSTAPEPVASAPVAPPVEPRSEDERYIRQIIDALSGPFIDPVRRAFKAKFGLLGELDLDRHGEALTWTTEVIAQIEAHLAGGGGSLGDKTVADIVADATIKLDPTVTEEDPPTGTGHAQAEGSPVDPNAMTPDEVFEASKLEPPEPATKNQLTSIKSLFRGNKVSASDQLAMVSELIKHPITDLAELTSAEAELLKKIL